MLSNEVIKRLEEMGAKRWQKGRMDRLYINASLFMDIEYYGTGNIHTAKFDGALISNSQARRLLGTKTYIDVEAESINSPSFWMFQKAEEMLEQAQRATAKVDRAAVMRRAWEIKRENKDNVFALCLKMAWAEAKEAAKAA